VVWMRWVLQRHCHECGAQAGSGLKDTGERVAALDGNVGHDSTSDVAMLWLPASTVKAAPGGRIICLVDSGTDMLTPAWAMRCCPAVCTVSVTLPPIRSHSDGSASGTNLDTAGRCRHDAYI